MDGMKMKNRTISLLIASIAILIIIQPVAAGVTPYFDNLAGFNADAGTPPVVVSFDSIPALTDITGTTINGIKFEAGIPTSAPLIVIKASDSYSPSGFDRTGTPMNRLFATSGDNVLSPGGIELAPGFDPLKENDDLVMTFNAPVDVVGFDILFQQLDGYSSVGIKVFDTSDTILYENDMIPIAVAPSNGQSGFEGGDKLCRFDL
jgi:hypothetical protein